MVAALVVATPVAVVLVVVTPVGLVVAYQGTRSISWPIARIKSK